MLSEDQLAHERAARKSLEQQLVEAHATIKRLEMQLAAARNEAAAASVAQRRAAGREVLSDCSDFSSAGHKKPSTAPTKNTNNNTPLALTTTGGGVRKKKTKERTSKPKIPGQSRYWTAEEHKLFLEALRLYGHKDLRSISAYVGTRNMTQCRTHSQKWQMKLMREAKRQTPAAAAVLNGMTESENGDGDKDGKNANACAAGNGAAGSSGAAAMADMNKDKYSISPHCGIALLSLVSTTFDN